MIFSMVVPPLSAEPAGQETGVFAPSRLWLSTDVVPTRFARSRQVSQAAARGLAISNFRPEDAGMKKAYSKPTLVRKGRLSAQTAQQATSGDSQAPE
jgi:hypothetical protein